MLRIAFFIIGLTFFIGYFGYLKEGFDPFLPEMRPDEYPNQSSFPDIILAEKYIQKEIRQTENPEISKYLTDLLNLLQFI